MHVVFCLSAYTIADIICIFLSLLATQEEKNFQA